MISVDELEAFDVYRWLRNGSQVGSILHYNQSTISRYCGRVTEILGLRSGRHCEVSGIGSDILLLMQREVHQQHRFAAYVRLRLQSTHWTNLLIKNDLPSGWISNPVKCTEPCRDAFQLLDNRVIDALITEGIQRPLDTDDRYQCFDIYKSPVRLVAHADNALVHERRLSSADISELGAIAPQSYMCHEAKECARLLFSQAFVQSDVSASLGKRHDVAWSIPTFSLIGQQEFAVDFGVDFSHRYVESVVVLRENAEWAMVDQLVSFLRSKYAVLAADQGFSISVHA